MLKGEERRGEAGVGGGDIKAAAERKDIICSPYLLLI